ncbi:cisplatin damage response ATP-dependent DNA ligase [Aestuariivirga litoralis]|uniref:cisplatin damage response ATP-dependent DNA ligase n=1 Tax=Aestuariivirga litoralis TaxID=2650924 RepID=UPI0018C8069F|nr:cisplatin damage response ATP-dependent DNA ligase [Aestuariivirga litoralis]
MKTFSALLERLYYEHGNLGKEKLLCEYFASTADPDRGYALAIIAGTLDIPNFKRGIVLGLISSRVDPTLLALSQDYVGELSETVAHLWPSQSGSTRELPALHEIVETLLTKSKADLPAYIAEMLDQMNSSERWAFLKIGTGTLRIGVSARFIKQVLAKFGDKPVEEIETLWHGMEPPYTSLFAWLEGKAEAPAVHQRLIFTPVMLAHALEEKDYPRITPADYAAEWKYDGIRVQLVSSALGKSLFTRTGDDIGHVFPEVLARMNFEAVLDGELIVKTAEGIGSFNALQQRLNRKNPSKKMIEDYPTAIVAYDILKLGSEDLRGLSYEERRRVLSAELEKHRPVDMELSPLVSFVDFDSLAMHRKLAAGERNIEGLMLKRRDSVYVAGRPTGPWYKWKHDPKLVDAVLMYAQRGSGKRSSYYSDYTFGLWKDDQLLPIGKAYFGFSDEELKQLDKWVRHHTTNSFGPVREVKRELVFEVAFDAVQRSKRHKSGFALRFPRISRIRWDKPAAEADHLEALEPLVG